MKKLMLLDGMSLINRAFYALPPLTTKAGVPTNAVLGFLNIYFKLLEEEAATHIAVVFDLPAPTFRHKRFSEYKATRKPFPSELRTQIPILKDLLAMMNISVVGLEGFEADDVMATIAVRAETEGFLTTIVTGDRDLLQIATNRIKIRIPKTKQGQTTTEDYFASDFIEKMGITPTEYIDAKALMGDASDNIPGVAGIGEKTALKLIQEHKTLENAIVAAASGKSAVMKNLVEQADIARLSKELATIVIDADVDVSLDSLLMGDMLTLAVFDEFRRLELRSLLKKFDTDFKSPSKISDQSSNVKTYDNLDKSIPCAYFLIDGVGVVLAQNDYVIALSDGEIKDFFESDVPKIGFDVKKDIRLLRSKNIQLNNLLFDGLIGGYLLGHLKDGDGVNELSLQYLGETLIVAEKNDTQLSLLDEPVDETVDLSQYYPHAMAILRSYAIINEQIKSQNMDKLFNEIEMSLIGVLADMEYYGVEMDADFIREYGDRLDVDINRLTSEIHGLAGKEFNINSPKQLAAILFEDMGLRGGKRTKTGFSTNVEVLQKLAQEHEIAAKILEYRSYAKLKSTYVDGLLASICPETDRIHTTFNQALTTTGRLSSNDPNLQNIPIRTALGRELRRAFVAADGFVFIDADYNQIELRILAQLSGDETFLSAFTQNQDIHRITAARVFHVDFDDVTDQMRSYAKAVNFGIVYGISAFSLAEDINVSVKEADGFIQNYFARYPAVKAFMGRAVAQAKHMGYAETLWGRRRELPELKHTNFNMRNFGERAAMNMPVQGSAADIIKIAMIKVYNRLRDEGLKSRLILQIHDELLIEAAVDEVDVVKQILMEEMQNTVEMDVPLTIDINVGVNWFDAK
ncbi:MAG: DNA polymerase I [Defluviitaleaceae bacterium]|nr:DNA polymerase I [Defluviitaleaceae bacterium]